MSEADQRGGRIPDNPFCVYCTDEAGKLKPYETVLQGMATFMSQSEDIPLDQALAKSETYMVHMPAWRNGES